MRRASWTTWLFVMMNPSGVKTKPLPLPPVRAGAHLDADDRRTDPLRGGGYSLRVRVERGGTFSDEEGQGHVGPSKPPAARAGFGKGRLGRPELRSAPCPDGGIGRRAGFRYQWWQHRGGSSPFLGSMCGHRIVRVRARLPAALTYCTIVR